MRAIVSAYVLAAVGLLIVYSPALRGGFVWDDVAYLRDTAPVQAADGLRRIWFTTEGRDYYPVTYSVFWLEWHLFGGNTTGYHIVNILLHAAGAVLLWQLLKQLQIPGAWLGALLFAVHPVNVPSVAWISELKNVLTLPFALLAVLFFDRYQRDGRRTLYAFSLLAFLLALLSKSAVVGLPVVLLALVWWRKPQLNGGDWLRLVPFAAIAGTMGLVTLWFQQYRALAGETVLRSDWLERCGTAGWAWWFYLFKSVVPVRLSMLYPQWHFDARSLLTYLPTLSILAVAAWLWSRRGEWGRPWLVALVSYGALLFPVLGFFDGGFYVYARVADHWQYFALPVICALAGAGIQRALAGGRQRERLASVCIGLFVLALATGSWSRAWAFRSDEALWTTTLEQYPDNWFAHYCLANHLARRGESESAMTHYRSAIRAHPTYAPAHYNLAVLLAGKQMFAEAAEHMAEACRLKPGQFECEYKLGLMHLELNQREQALICLREAVRLRPDYAPATEALAWLLAQDTPR